MTTSATRPSGGLKRVYGSTSSGPASTRPTSRRMRLRGFRRPRTCARRDRAADATQIFRRGLPFIETTSDGQLRVGLNFCSFQASLAQFDVVFNDWLMSRQFPPQPDGSEPGVDALLDPTRQLTAIEKAGFFFVPPYDEQGLAAAVFSERHERARTTGRLVVHKRVTDPNDPSRRFERGGFSFQVCWTRRGSRFQTRSSPPTRQDAGSARSS